MIVRSSEWARGCSPLLALLLAFGALGVAAGANSKSNDAKQVAAAGGGGGTKVTLSEFKIDPAMIIARRSTARSPSPTAAPSTTTSRCKGTDVRTKTLNPGESATRLARGPEDRATTPRSARSPATPTPA